MPDPAAVLSRLTDRLAPLERELYRAYWTAATDASPETSSARQRAEEALLAVLGDPSCSPRSSGPWPRMTGPPA
jgi:hypothetical protein